MEVKKYCHVYRQNNFIYLHPIIHESLTDLCKANKTHTCSYYPPNQIFDLRKDFITNNIASPYYFYVTFLDSSKEPISLENHHIKTSTIYNFNRKRIRKNLVYLPNVSIKENPEHSNYMLHLGTINQAYNRNLATDKKYKIFKKISKFGYGFFGFKIETKDINPKYAVITIKNELMLLSNNNNLELNLENDPLQYNTSDTIPFAKYSNSLQNGNTPIVLPSRTQVVPTAPPLN